MLSGNAHLALGQNLVALVNIKIAEIYVSVHPTNMDNNRFDTHTPILSDIEDGFQEVPPASLESLLAVGQDGQHIH